MNNKFLFLIVLAVISIVTTSCGGTPAATELPTEPAVTEAPGATEPPTEQPAATEAPTQPPVLDRIPPSDPIFPGEKASLEFESEPPFSVLTVIGFIFPDGQAAIKAAPIEGISSDPDGPNGFTMIGVVEVGSDAEGIEAGLYSVAINLTSQEDVVDGLIISSKDSSITYQQHFSRIPQAVNSQRDPSNLPDPGVSILSDSVCYMVGLGEPKSYFRYCAVTESYLSVKSQFSTEYQSLMDEVEESAATIDFPGELILDLSISELEDTPNIEACNSNSEDCDADILGAPISNFPADYANAKSQATSDPFVITAGFMRVQRELNVAEITVQTGNYRIEYWFNPDGTFIGATLFGKTDSDIDVIDQQIPAGEPAFVNPDQSKPITSDISAWKLCGQCLIRQSSCP